MSWQQSLRQFHLVLSWITIMLMWLWLLDIVPLEVPISAAIAGLLMMIPLVWKIWPQLTLTLALLAFSIWTIVQRR